MKKSPAKTKKILGFIGQGYVGKNYADYFEKHGYKVVRYALEEPYVANKGKIKECDIVFIAVPTPTTPKGFDASIVENALKLVAPGTNVVIKSTVLPGTTRRLQKRFPKLKIFFSPEYLSIATAAYDTAHPFATLVGTPSESPAHLKAAKDILGILPKAPFSMICKSEEAEVSKYAHNISGYTQILTFNLMYDMAGSVGAEWSAIQKAIENDPYVPNRYASPIHKSGRGAGGGCFIKDYAAFTYHYEKLVGQKEGVSFLNAGQQHNLSLLLKTNKDRDLLEGVYGKETIRKAHKVHSKRAAKKK